MDSLVNYITQRNGTTIEDVNFSSKCFYASLCMIMSYCDKSYDQASLDKVVADIEPYKGPKSIGNMIVERFPWAQKIFKAHGRLGADFRTAKAYLNIIFPERQVYYLDPGNWEELEKRLQNDIPVMIFTDKGKLTGSGHYIVLTRLISEGIYEAADPWFGNGKRYAKEQLVFNKPYYLVMI